jgi:hypothetical protein
MAKAPKRRLGPISLLFLALLLVGYVYVLAKYPLWVVGVTLVLVGVTVLLNLRMKRHLARLAASRAEDDICTFARAFDRRSVDPWVLRAVYEELQDHLRGEYPGFPILPTDRLREGLELDDDDLEMDLAPDIAARTGRVLPRRPVPNQKPVRTVQDLVEFFCAQQKAAT